MIKYENCNGCMALSGDGCTLGCKIEPLFFSMCYVTTGYKPLEPCHKPQTKDGYKTRIDEGRNKQK